MSYVTSVMVAINVLEPRELTDALVQPIPEGSHGEALKELTGEDWGGYKGGGGPLYAAAFNYLNKDAFLAWLRALPWQYGHKAQVFIKGENDEVWTVEPVLEPPMRWSGVLQKYIPEGTGPLW